MGKQTFPEIFNHKIKANKYHAQILIEITSTPTRVRGITPPSKNIEKFYLVAAKNINKMLRINLKTKTFREEAIPDSVYEPYLGGRDSILISSLRKILLEWIPFLQATSLFYARVRSQIPESIAPAGITFYQISILRVLLCICFHWKKRRINSRIHFFIDISK